MADTGLHIVLISVHGLVRGHDLELGRDADTGGQTLYVVELARALAARDEVRRVDLVTQLVEGPDLAPDYARGIEELEGGARILRFPCGGTDYVPKERLWDRLDGFADHLIEHYRGGESMPDVVHGHYADAGRVGSRLAAVLDVPYVHTGHSLGRVKRRRMIAQGLDARELERRYAMSRRIEAEEQTLASAARVIASTHQEIEEQYELYDFYRPEAMHVIPPGTDLSRFRPPQGGEKDTGIAAAVRRFLKDPDKPMILALSRADARKNIAALVHAYGRDETLGERANLVLVIGNRDDLTTLDDGARDVLTELLQLIDRYDLYGRVAYPKHHRPDDVPVLYRLATLSGGVFVNPALTEPFGLTLIEAAASGLPIVATEDGGPRDIVANCDNGLLVDPLEPREIARAIGDVIGNWEEWQRRSQTGLESVRECYSWAAHAEAYLEMLRPVLEAGRGDTRQPADPARVRGARPAHRALFADLNGCLIGDAESLERLVQLLRRERRWLLFGITTGLRRDAALRLLRRHRIPEPDFLVTSTGTDITYAPKLTEDDAWRRHIEKEWTPRVVRRVLDGIEGLRPRSRDQQADFKVTYRYDPDVAPPVDEIAGRLFQEDQAVNVIRSHGKFLNVVPIRASKGLALRYLAGRFGIPLDSVLAIGSSAADEDMLRGNTLAAVVGGRAHRELGRLAEIEEVYFANASHATGIMEAMEHFGFLEPPPAADGGADGDPGARVAGTGTGAGTSADAPERAEPA